jgi:hypothetical protein
MDIVQSSWKGLRTFLGVFGDSFLVALAITGAVSAAVTAATLVLQGL